MKISSQILFVAAVLYTSYSAAQVKIFEKGPDVNNKNIHTVIEQLESKAPNGWESHLSLSLNVNKSTTNPNRFKVYGAKNPKGYAGIIIYCEEFSGSGSMLQSVPKTEKRRIVYSSKWTGMLDTESMESNKKPDFIINSKQCEEGTVD